MFKVWYLTIIFFFYTFFTFCQHRNDIWMLGYDSGGNPPKQGLDFSNGTADTFSLYRQMEFFITNASICDTNGQLLFYTNGEQIANRFHSTLLNSTNFNTGWGQTFYTAGLAYSQSCIILPDPGDQLKYYLFYVANEDLFTYKLPGDTTTHQDLQPFNLNYSIVNMLLDNGSGGIEPGKKNLTLLNDTLLLGRITACKHANGRDWWLIVHKYYSDLFYKVLITPNGVSIFNSQSIGPILMPSDGLRDFDVWGQSYISPDGNRLAMAGQSNIIDIYKFDRCTGQLDSAVSFKYPDTIHRVKGLSFSPNSRFLYVSHFYNIYQYDTWSINIDSSRILVATWDSFNDPIFNLPMYFLFHQLAPNNKIYISTWGGSVYFHTINNPDSLGIACGIQQHSLVLSSYKIDIPSFPNYNLGSEPGSPCDTITVDLENINPQSQYHLKLYPNPASLRIYVQYDLPENSVLLFSDVTGRVINKLEFISKSGELDFDTRNFGDGSYFYQVISSNMPITSGKLVIIH